MRQSSGQRAKFILELIKPSHYDDDGYVIQWWRGWIPSNSLSVLHGLAREAQSRQVLGEETDIEIDAFDETISVVPLKRIIRRFRRNRMRGLVCLVGVQTNQFPRAVDIARRLRVAIGGFHVSGCVSMLPETPPEMREALGLGITLFAGEAEGRLDGLLRDADRGELKPFYNFIADLPHLEGQPLPYPDRSHLHHILGRVSSFDAGRGCPFSCSFCTIINVQGRKSRYRDADDIERLVRVNQAQGSSSYFITDDDFARNKNWEAILDRLIELREREGIEIRLTIQVDVLCHKIPRFVEKAARAGCKRVFIGLESINPDNLKAASKRQNRVAEYRAMLQAWRRVGVITYAGYILGFPDDTPEKIRHDIRVIQRELPIDILEFFVLTPLPGSRDHQEMHLRGVRLDPDMNRYDVEHVTTDHPRMTAAEWQSIYDEAWRLYYSPGHIETLLKRAIVSGVKPARVATMIFSFYAGHKYEGVHPLQVGLIRRKRRRDRRPGMQRENPLVFYPRRLGAMFTTYVSGLLFFWRLTRLRRRLQRDPAIRDYSDIAIAPADAEADQRLELLGGGELETWARPAV